MEKKIKVGILKETKIPPDRRVAIAPEQGKELLKKFPQVELFIQHSENRCFSDKEYSDSGLTVKEDLSDCDILIGVKEVNISTLIPDKTYLFFSHTTKEQPHNRKLLQEIVRRKISLIDYEHLTDKGNIRLVSFSRWAGIVGAYNGLIAYGLRKLLFDLLPAHQCSSMEEMFAELKKVKLDNIKILISGGGRVAYGAMETLAPLKLKKVTPAEFLTETFNEPVYCQIDPWNYVKRKQGEWIDLEHFFKHPDEYESTFLPYTKVTDFFIACHYWDPKSPVFMTKQDMKANDYKMSVIADVSCDVNGPIPSTIRASSIAEPFYGYNPVAEKEADTFNKNNITVMAVDNLPGELPRDSSVYFGKELVEKIFPYLFGNDNEGIIERATIVKQGKLSEKYAYLVDYVAEK